MKLFGVILPIFIILHIWKRFGGLWFRSSGFVFGTCFGLSSVARSGSVGQVWPLRARAKLFAHIIDSKPG